VLLVGENRFLYAVLIIVLILASQGIAIEVSAVVAIFGLSIGWIAGWRRGRRLYQRYYRGELARLEGMRGRSEEPAETTTEDIVQETMVKGGGGRDLPGINASVSTLPELF
jgi:hypothetical protein